jgi:hypothetical protein
VDLFLLDASRYYTKMKKLKKAVTKLDFSGLDLKGPQGDLYHFEVINNPYAQKGAMVYLMHKKKYKTGYTPIPFKQDPAGEDLVKFFGGLTHAVPLTVPFIINQFFGKHYQPFDHQWGTLAQQNPYVSYVGPGSVVCSLGLDQKDSYAAYETCQALNTDQQALWYEFRFVPKVTGLLAFQRFPKTCVFEIAGLGSDKLLKFIDRVLAKLEKDGIAFTFHWGKYLPLGPQETRYGFSGPFKYRLDAGRLRAMYTVNGVDRVALWKKQREKLFGGDEALMDVFSNGLMEKLGLAD